jgi:hypothetical protein
MYAPKQLRSCFSRSGPILPWWSAFSSRSGDARRSETRAAALDGGSHVSWTMALLAGAMTVRAAWCSASSTLWRLCGFSLGGLPFPVLEADRLCRGETLALF